MAQRERLTSYAGLGVALAALVCASAASAQTATASAGATDPRVDIFEYDVEGNTLLKTVDIQRALRPYVGPQHPLSDTDKARAALQKAYSDRGYQAVSVVLPPQSVTGGMVRIQVTEAKTTQVAVVGRHYEPEREITSALPALAPGQSPNFNALNKQLTDLNGRSADLQVTPQLKPGAGPDALDVELDVKDQRPLHGGLELNNNYSPDTHALRLQANLAYDDLWGMGHSISGFYDVAPERRSDAEVYVLTYGAPVPGTNIRVTLSGLVSNSNVTTLGDTGVLGKGHSVTLTGIAPLPSVGAFTQSLQASVAYKDFTDRLTVVGQTDSTPITYYPFAVTYTAGWRGQKDQLSGNIGLNVAIRGLGSGASAYDAKRYLALPDFIYLKAQASWQHDLPWAAQFYLEGDGQVANEPLISNEQFSGGGEGSVRSYLISEALGDNGVHGTAELRSPPVETWLDPKGTFLSGLKVVGFVDTARLWLLSPLPGQQSDVTLASVGLGLRLTLPNPVITTAPFHFDVDWGDPLVSNGSTLAGQSRVQFRLYSNF